MRARGARGRGTVHGSTSVFLFLDLKRLAFEQSFPRYPRAFVSTSMSSSSEEFKMIFPNRWKKASATMTQFVF